MLFEILHVHVIFTFGCVPSKSCREMYVILHDFCVIRYSDTARKPDQLPPMDNGATGTDVKQSAALPSIGKLEMMGATARDFLKKDHMSIIVSAALWLKYTAFMAY